MRSRIFLFLLIPFLLLCTILTYASSLQATSQERTRTTPPLVGGIDEVPSRLPPTIDSDTSWVVQQPTMLLPWSKVVFYAYRGSNWDIYLAQDDGSSEQRLTYHDDADLGPNLDRGSKRITFFSDRDGDDEIYVMNANGASLQKLTNNSSDDFNPSWSPDSSKIVFQSNRNGQFEVYVMDASGQNQQRLTNHSAYDGMPSWSPNGNKLLFSSNRSGGWHIWVMDADGSNPVQLSQQSLSENPVWSPDGNQIAYDADGNNDGWLELWVMNADGSNQRKVYDPGYPYDVWVSSWSPDGNRVAFTRAEWYQYQGDWYWVGAKMYNFSVLNSSLINMHSSDPVVDPNWQTTDVSPPISSLGLQPAYQQDTAELPWIAEDPGGAGILHYDVQYRIGQSDTWLDWRTEASPDGLNMIYFAPISGETIYFRTRAVDRSFNMESWPDGAGDTFTTFYDWAISGSATDNRGTPLIGVSADDQQYAFDILPSNNAGGFSSYFTGQEDTFAPFWSNTGYMDLPATTYAAERDVTQDIVMPPLDNVVANWGFETGTFSNSDWIPGGLPSPVLTTTNPHTGQYATFLGETPVFTPTVTLYGDDYSFVYNSDLRRDANGNLHATWKTSSGDDFDLFYSRRPPDGSWDTPEPITTIPGDINYFTWDVSANGQVDVAWIISTADHSELFHARRSSAGTWSSPVHIIDQVNITDPLINIDSDYKAHLTWAANSDGHHFYSQAGAGGTWTSPTAFMPIENYFIVDTIADANGKLHLLWSRSGNDISYSYRAVDGSWSTRELVATGDYNWNQYFTVTSGGEIHVVWSRYGSQLYHRQRSVTGQWSAVKTLVMETDISDREVSLGTTTDDDVYVIWAERYQSGCQNLSFAHIDANNTWIEQTQIPLQEQDICIEKTWWGQQGQNGTMPFAIVASYNRICSVALGSGNVREPHCMDFQGDLDTVNLLTGGMNSMELLWHDNSRVYFTEIAPVQTADLSLIQQEIMIPNSGTNPTLSFLYRLETAVQSGGYLEVNALTGVDYTSLFSATESTNGWTHQWLDMETWAGQTITLSIELQQAVGAIPAQALIDEVTIGRAYPDTWLQITGDPNCLPGDTATMLIQYGNRGGVDAGAGVITLTLPVEMQFVSADPAPTATTPTYRWEIADMPIGSTGIITVVTNFSSEVILFDEFIVSAGLSNSTAELALQNNKFGHTFQVGSNTMLPIILKE